VLRRQTGEFLHACEGEMVCKSTMDKVPHFNAPIYLENKQQIGKVDEILGPINTLVRAHLEIPSCDLQTRCLPVLMDARRSTHGIFHVWNMPQNATQFFESIEYMVCIFCLFAR
jgi:hypothetical protein